jgi:uracil-DNA glycosylase
MSAIAPCAAPAAGNSIEAMAEERGEQTSEQRREALKQVFERARSCTRCAELAATRRNVVFGAGNANADLMFVGEAPGASEDEQGLPFVGQAGKLLNKLLEEIGLSREEVFIANTLKCLRYDAQIQLADGSWERIGRLVESRYGGEVMSVDDSGELVRRRVTGWHTSPLAGRRVYRLSFRDCDPAGVGRVGVQLTGDHPVLTERGYVPVEALGEGDRIATGQGLSELARDVVCPTVLGEGRLQSQSAYLSRSRSHRQLEYARFKARPRSEIATVSFSDADLQVLIAGLRGLGISTKALRKRLYFDVASTERLSALIAPYVPASMRYKLHPEVAARVPFDPNRLQTGPRAVVYADVEAQDITGRKRADSTFFCLDVEGTHNFVTAGGVVHNCRPPGNRDPQPVEIENCKEYLYRQVELIQPSVICTLGNFATKLLRDDPMGITRVHGQAEVLALGRRAVRLYPIFHPAAALYTPRMLETLREDFARLPELLALGPPEQPQAVPDFDLPDLPAEAELAAEGAGAKAANGTNGSAGDANEAAAEPHRADQLDLF